MVNTIIVSKRQKILICGLTNWYTDPRDPAAKRDTVSGCFSWARQVHSFLPGGGSYMAPISDPCQHTALITRWRPPHGSFQVKEACTFTRVKILHWYLLLSPSWSRLPLSHTGKWDYFNIILCLVSLWFICILYFICVSPKTAQPKRKHKNNDLQSRKVLSEESIKVAFLLLLFLPASQ